MSLKITLIAASLLAFSSTIARADESNAGVIYFTGEIINPTCEIKGDSGHDSTIFLGAYAPSYFTDTGKSDDVSFPIILTKCPAATEGLPRIQLTFTGTPVDATHPTLLALTAGGASGVGVSVSTEDEPDTDIDITGADNQVFISLLETEGDISKTFLARYVSLSGTDEGVQPGEANTQMTIGILYR